MEKVLFVVDMQNDFLTGSLANESAVEIIPNIKREIESGYYDHIIFTRDTHSSNYLNTQEGKLLPVPHCIFMTKGWEVCEELSNLNFKTSKIAFLNKPTFGYAKWGEFIRNSSIKTDDDCEFTFTGTCTDICVISNALAVKAAFPESKVRCIADCCAPLMGSDAKQNATFEVMKSCQIDVIGE